MGKPMLRFVTRLFIMISGSIEPGEIFAKDRKALSEVIAGKRCWQMVSELIPPSEKLLSTVKGGATKMAGVSGGRGEEV